MVKTGPNDWMMKKINKKNPQIYGQGFNENSLHCGLLWDSNLASYHQIATRDRRSGFPHLGIEWQLGKMQIFKPKNDSAKSKKGETNYIKQL
jgi:hypothetical protein